VPSKAEQDTYAKALEKSRAYYQQVMETWDVLPPEIRAKYQEVLVGDDRVVMGTAEDLWSRGYSPEMSMQKLETFIRMQREALERQRDR
jgi:hypothetical protein